MRTILKSALVCLIVGFALVQTASGDSVAFNGGVNWTTNSNKTIPTFSSNSVVMTNGQFNEATSIWFDNTQSLGSFTASFTYTATFTPGKGPADGITLAFQDAGTNYLGLGSGAVFGGALGYGTVPGIPSAALALNIYAGSPGGAPGTQLYSDGQTAQLGGAPYMSTLPVALASGHPISVSVTYDSGAGTLGETLTDTVLGTTFTNTYSGVNLASEVGSSVAYVGFTAGTGGLTSNQTISDFQFTSVPEPSSLLLLSTGLLGLAGAMRRKRLA